MKTEITMESSHFTQICDKKLLCTIQCKPGPNTKIKFYFTFKNVE